MRISLRTKLTSILAVPMLALTAFAGRGVQHAMSEGHRDRASAARIELSVAATTAAVELARERALSAATVDPPAPPPPPPAPPTDPSAPPAPPTPAPLAAPTSQEIAVRKAALTQQRAATSHAVDALRSRMTGQGDAIELGTAPALDQLGRLAAARDGVDTGERNAADVLGAYSEIIDPVLDLDQAAVGRVADPTTLAHLEAFQALSRAMQDMVAERSLLERAFTGGTLDKDTYNHVVDLAASQRVWFDLFQRHAAAGELARFGQAQALPATASAQRMRDAALSAGADGHVQISASDWVGAMDQKIDALDAIADDTARDLAQGAEAQRVRSGAVRSHALLLLLAVVLLGAVLYLLLHRFVLRPIGRLKSAADRAAHVALPAAIEAAHDQGPAAARRMLAPLPASGDSDLAELAAAFDSAQTTALALAADEADLRSKANAVFVNFGRRTEDLVTRQLSHIDEIESRTEDPDTLADIFTLDHLATRLRRNAESLMVMAGAASPRPWSRPVSVINVVRAAVAESTDYARVDVEGISSGAIAGVAANDVSHLLAELVDNALAFSPSESRVKIAGGWVESGHYLVTVSDAGAGMSSGQLTEANERISGSNVSDPGMSRYFGMYVVGRFARRHGIEVQLVPSRAAGTTAEILLPDELMVGALAECQTTPGS